MGKIIKYLLYSTCALDDCRPAVYTLQFRSKYLPFHVVFLVGYGYSHPQFLSERFWNHCFTWFCPWVLKPEWMNHQLLFSCLHAVIIRNPKLRVAVASQKSDLSPQRAPKENFIIWYEPWDWQIMLAVFPLRPCGLCVCLQLDRPYRVKMWGHTQQEYFLNQLHYLYENVIPSSEYEEMNIDCGSCSVLRFNSNAMQRMYYRYPVYQWKLPRAAWLFGW